VQVLSDYDLDSGNFKDKESKIAYLNKVIGAVSDAVGAVAVKPLKIVAGLEPENTNALLQALARAAAGGAPATEPPKEERRKRAEATLPPQPAEVERPQRAEGRSRRKEEPERELPAPEAAPPPARAPQPERETIQPL
jgi:TRAF3-interacting protein 1